MRPLPSHFLSMNQDWTTRRLNSFPESSSSAAATAAFPPPAVQTIASNSAGQTVYITITQEVLPTATLNLDTPTGLSDTGSVGSNGTRVGAISGGVVGGIVVLGSVVFLLFFLRRRKQTKERRRATLPPPYVDGDMSEELGTTATAAVDAETKVAVGNDEESTTVPQLDSTMVDTPIEVIGDDLGAIAELPATPNAVSITEPSTAADSPDEQPRHSREAKNVNAEDHVMSWAQYISMKNRDPSSRLSQPHGAPDTSISVWENMNPSKPSEK